MPRGDGTGPAGMGPMTGRGAGYCAGYSAPGFANPNAARPAGRGIYGQGSGRGRGYRNMYYATGLPYWLRNNPYPEAQAVKNEQYGPQEGLAGLKEQSRLLQQQLDMVQKKIEELSSKEEPGQEKATKQE
jgi:hypothetical protein